MELTTERDGGLASMPCIEARPDTIRAAGNPLATRILKLLIQHPDGLYATQIAKRLDQPVQKVAYHIRRLTAAGIIRVESIAQTSGGVGKTLRLTAPAIAIRLGEFTPATKTHRIPPAHATFLSPFIKDGKLDARIVIGSPDPHGQEGARSRDAALAIDLAMTIGAYLTARPEGAAVLDTELRDPKQNLIVIGGPVVNKVAERMNHHSPIPYDNERKRYVSRRTGHEFSDDTIGIIAKMPNPLAPGKWILLIQGKRHAGTRAAVTAINTAFDSICTAKRTRDGSSATVVEGIDADSDGMIDTVKVLE